MISQRIVEGVARLVQENSLFSSSRDPNAPILRVEDVAGERRLAARQTVGHGAAGVGDGPGWVGILLASAEAVLSLEPVRHHSARIEIGVVGPHRSRGEAAFELRAFFSDHLGGLIEDPVTGSLNASIAQWLLATGRAEAPYVAAQGTRLGRTGRIHVARGDDGAIWIGGRTQTLFRGETTFPHAVEVG